MRQSNVERLAGVVLNGLLIAGIIGLCQIVAILFGWEPARDATDGPAVRSDMALRTDYGTGCQYLASTSGSLTPRMGADGKQVCGVHQ